MQAPFAHQKHRDFDHVDGNLKEQQPVQLTSHLDTLSVWQAVRVYKRVTLVAMVAAFSVSLDGYRSSKQSQAVDHPLIQFRDQPERFDRCQQGFLAASEPKLNYNPGLRVGLGRHPISWTSPRTGRPAVLYGVAWKEVGFVRHLGHSTDRELSSSVVLIHSNDSLKCSHRVFGQRRGDVAGCQTTSWSISRCDASHCELFLYHRSTAILVTYTSGPLVHHGSNAWRRMPNQQS
jgi:hypothetical protein